MSFDCSRFPFNSWNDYGGVVMQQGRVQLDSDWNEWLAEINRRIQAGTVDILGRAVYPASTPNAFRINLVGGQITIGSGRMYVDGLLAENHGPGPASSAQWDPVLAELSNTPPGAKEIDLPYTSQPYLPAPDPLPTNGTQLVYLDVWRRAVTSLEDPSLVEKAVGVDTTGRLQTAWQVNVLPADSNATCSSDVPAWDTLIQPSAARLTTGTGPAGDPGPCCLTPNTGYTGMENQLYRVEIHQSGQPNSGATFKWSRDNASVATAVTAVSPTTNSAGTATSQLNVQSAGKDNVLCFSPGDWIEITDDYLELRGEHGELHQIDVGGVDKVNKIIRLRTPVLADFQGRITKPPANYPDCHARISRWDQGGQVFQGDGKTPWVNLNTSTSGDIPVPPANTSVLLENGIIVTFSSSSTGGNFNSGDFWTFSARASDGSVEILSQAPPQGLHHHYARLAVVTFPSATPSDCRNPWPPAVAGDAGCECAACVTADGHNQGTFTIQEAINKVKGLGGGKVCLGPGNYNITETVNISGADSLTIVGHGSPWLLWAPTAPPGTASQAAILIDTSVGVTLEDFGLLVPAATTAPAQGPPGISVPPPHFVLNPGVMIQNCAFVNVQRCAFLCLRNKAPGNPAIGLGGFVAQITVKNNFISFSIPDIGIEGITNIGPGVGLSHLPTIVPTGTAANPLLLTLDLYVQGNFIQTSSSGVDLDVLSYHAWQVQIKNNFIGPSSVAGITVAGLGLPAPDSSVEITNNEIVTVPTGHGIVCGVGGVRISDNDILCPTSNPSSTTVGDGILLEVPLLAAISLPVDGLQLVGNRISGVGGIGIEIRSQVASAIIHQNLIENTGAGGIIMTGSVAGVPSTAQHLSIANNQLLGLIPDSSNPMVALLNAALGIRLLFTAAAEIAGNIVVNLGLGASGNASVVGIGLLACGSVLISGNQVGNIGNADATSNPSAGIAVLGPPIGRVEVSGNRSQRSDTLTKTGSSTRWYALLIGPLTDFSPLLARLVQVDTNTSVFLAGSSAVEVNAGLQAVSVRGNFLAAATFSALAEVDLSGTSGTESCIFCENQCVLISIGDFKPKVLLSAPLVIASNNVIKGGDFIIDTPTTTPAQATILGNLLNGGAIELNGASVGSPWSGLNI